MRDWERPTAPRPRIAPPSVLGPPPTPHPAHSPSPALAAPAHRSATFDSIRKFKHLSISLGFKAVSDVCQAAFDHPETDFDEFPEVAPDHRPGCWCVIDVAEFTKHTAAVTALVKMFLDNKGELPPAAEARIIRVEKKFYYDDV